MNGTPTFSLSGAGALLLRPSTPAAARGAVHGLRRAPISATVLTRNSERLLAEVLAALAWCDEVIVLDTGSTDGTLAIARSCPNAQVRSLEGGFTGFGTARRQAVAAARHDWILSVDSDEIVSAELAAEVAGLALDPRCVYSIRFDNYYAGRRITTCGWAPDRHPRLFHRGATNFCASPVHEAVQLGAGQRRVKLRYPIRHYSYATPADFLVKMQAYTRLFAAQHAGRRPASPLRAVARSAWAFGKSYFLERGCLQGAEGLTISAYKSQTVFWKYMLLRHRNEALR